jgi:hypothetical protein
MTQLELVALIRAHLTEADALLGKNIMPADRRKVMGHLKQAVEYMEQLLAKPQGEIEPR